MTINGLGSTQITMKKGQGITQALKELVTKNKMKLSDGTISKAEWNATLKVLDDIQASRKANNQASIFGKNYLVKEGAKIDFTENEMSKIYSAMGVEFSQEVQNEPKKEEQIPDVKKEDKTTENKNDLKQNKNGTDNNVQNQPKEDVTNKNNAFDEKKLQPTREFKLLDKKEIENKDGSKTITYEYNIDGKSVKDERTIYHNDDGSVKVITGMVNTKGGMSYDCITYKTNPDGTTLTSYDDDNNGKVNEEVIRDKNGELKEKIRYINVERTFEDGTKVPIKEVEHTYWDNGKHTASSKSTIIDGKEVHRKECTFTENGAEKSHAEYENGKLISRSETSYYPDGSIVKGLINAEKEERIYDENNQLTTIIEYTYPKDENGNVIAQERKETDVKTGEVTVRRYDENNPEILTGTVELGH